MECSRTREQGFSLIQMAIMLMVLGLVLSSVVSIYVGRIQKDMAKRALTAIRLTRDEIIGFTIDSANHFLPTGDATGAITEAGFSLSSATDPWGQPWRYIVAGNPTCTQQLYATDLTALSGTGLSVTAYGNTYNNVAFVLVSPGPNGSVETTLPAAVNPTTCPGTTAILDLGAGTPPNDDMVEFVILSYIQGKL